MNGACCTVIADKTNNDSVCTAIEEAFNGKGKLIDKVGKDYVKAVSDYGIYVPTGVDSTNVKNIKYKRFTAGEGTLRV